MTWQRGDVVLVDWPSASEPDRKAVAHRNHYFGDDGPWMLNCWGFQMVTDAWVDSHNPVRLVPEVTVQSRSDEGS